MSSKTIELAKRYPVIAMFITFGSMAAAALAIWNLGGPIDASVVTHAELAEIFKTHSAQPHAGAQQQINAIRQESRCDSVDIQIAILSDVIWRLEQTEPDGMRLVEKRGAMVKLLKRRDALGCANLA